MAAAMPTKIDVCRTLDHFLQHVAAPFVAAEWQGCGARRDGIGAPGALGLDVGHHVGQRVHALGIGRRRRDFARLGRPGLDRRQRVGQRVDDLQVGFVFGRAGLPRDRRPGHDSGRRYRRVRPDEGGRRVVDALLPRPVLGDQAGSREHDHHQEGGDDRQRHHRHAVRPKPAPGQRPEAGRDGVRNVVGHRPSPI